MLQKLAIEILGPDIAHVLGHFAIATAVLCVSLFFGRVVVDFMRGVHGKTSAD